jgi:hypothetical protein
MAIVSEAPLEGDSYEIVNASPQYHHHIPANIMLSSHFKGSNRSAPVNRPEHQTAALPDGRNQVVRGAPAPACSHSTRRRQLRSTVAIRTWSC